MGFCSARCMLVFLWTMQLVSYRGLQGSNEMSQKTLIQISAAWSVAFLLSAPAIVFWDIVAGHSNVPEGTCTYEFNYAWHLLIFLTLMDFYAPFLSIVYFNLRIYWNIRKRSLKRKNTLLLQTCNNKPVVFLTLESKYSNQTLPSPVKLAGQRLFSFHKEKPFAKKLKNTLAPPVNPGKNLNQASVTEQLKLKKDKQIAKSLAVIVCVYCICWLPYTLTFFVQAICQGQCFDPYFVDISLWPMWINSSINPFLYPLCHKNFKRAFAKLLCHIV